MLIRRRSIDLFNYYTIFHFIITSSKLNLLLILSLIGIYKISASLLNRQQVFISIELRRINSLIIEIEFYLDMISIFFITTVIIISFSVFRFMYSYITPYKFFSRFSLLLRVFVLSIILLILSSNLIFTMVGWDGLGIRSYLLVIYYGSQKSFNAGILTVLRNRVGDVILLLAIALVLSEGSWNVIMYHESINTISLLLFLVILGAMTKSAQIPFSAWLPAAMAAPTPVSSLVHSSTLVTAGIYLLIRHLRWIKIFQGSAILRLLGLSTITIASLSALNEKDIKKMVALSTLRQLGLIIRSLGCQWVFIRFIHIILHAYFKAIMFISVGNLIHFSQNYQALHNRGILYFRSPLNGSTLILASISLCGAPFSAAFFSKEPIIELTCHSAEFLGPLIIILIRVILTMLYRRRLIKLTLISYRTIKSRASLVENDFLLTKGIIRLSVPSFSSGAIISRIMIVKPCRFVYSIWVKYFIISRLFLVIIILFIAKFPIFKIGGGLTLSLWALRPFSYYSANYQQISLSSIFQVRNFRGPIISIINVLALMEKEIRPLFSNQFIFRAISSIPLIILLLIIL